MGEESSLAEHDAKQEEPNNYGSIIFIETGAGKSYISLMLIKSLFGETLQELVELTPDQLRDKKINSQNSSYFNIEGVNDSLVEELTPRKKVVFIVPTNNLVD
jgi:replicative superfamily II helicase